MSHRLRIAQVAPLAWAVEPGSTQSIEQLVSLLTEELVRRGHRVTLFAAGNSRTAAELHAVYPRGYCEDASLFSWQLHEYLHIAAAFERAADFDVIHSHAYAHALPFTGLVSTPVAHTYHVLPDRDIVGAFARCPEAHLVAASDFHRGLFHGSADVAVVPHGIDTAAFPFGERPGDYLFFLGRLIPDKGAVEAVRLARRVGMRLVLAGPSTDEDYFRTQVAPLIDGRDVQYVGPVGAARRNELLAGAAALVYPLLYPEPFGLVLVEAMACGTPVLAPAVGAVPEIVEPGVTGYLAPDVESLAAGLPAVLALDRARVRRAAAERFDYRRMVDGYEAVYRRLAARRQKASA
jgi:glycosyltransferase involved in cell wall biosynthesis